MFLRSSKVQSYSLAWFDDKQQILNFELGTCKTFITSYVLITSGTNTLKIIELKGGGCDFVHLIPYFY